MPQVYETISSCIFHFNRNRALRPGRLLQPDLRGQPQRRLLQQQLQLQQRREGGRLRGGAAALLPRLPEVQGPVPGHLQVAGEGRGDRGQGPEVDLARVRNVSRMQIELGDRISEMHSDAVNLSFSGRFRRSIRPLVGLVEPKFLS